MRFADRADAGRQLAIALADFRDPRAIVLGLARGGMAVAEEVARALRLPLDVLVVRKLGAPGNPELAIGAVAGDVVHVQRDVARQCHADDAYVQAAVAEARREQARRERLYRAGRPPLADLLRGRTVLLVDDGLATGASATAAIEAVRQYGAVRVLFAAPVCADPSATALDARADAVICLFRPEPFIAVGAHYDQFDPLPDEEVLRCLRDAVSGAPQPAITGRP